MRERGFTLLELLAALAVLAVLGALGFRGLNSVLETESRLQVETRRWNDVALLFSQLGEDMTMAVERPVREVAGHEPGAELAGVDRSHPSPTRSHAPWHRRRLGGAKRPAARGLSPA